MGRRIVNIALLGAGAMGRCHAETIACHLRDARLAATADRAEARARHAVLLDDNPLVADTAPDTPAPGAGERQEFATGGIRLRSRRGGVRLEGKDGDRARDRRAVPAVTGHDGVRALEIAPVAIRSQREGLPVRV